jgi:hypothetical protein
VIIILCLDAPKSIRETEKKPKNLLVWAKKPKKTQKKPKNPKKTPKKQKNPLGWFFFLKTRVFSNPAFSRNIFACYRNGAHLHPFLLLGRNI